MQASPPPSSGPVAPASYPQHEVSQEPPELAQSRDYLRLSDRLTAVIAALWMAVAGFLVANPGIIPLLVGTLFFAFGAMALVVFFVGFGRIQPLMDGGHFHEAKQALFLWGILGLVGGALPGLLLLIVRGKLDPVISWQQSVMAASSQPAPPYPSPPSAPSLAPSTGSSAPPWATSASSAPPPASPAPAAPAPSTGGYPYGGSASPASGSSGGYLPAATYAPSTTPSASPPSLSSRPPASSPPPSPSSSSAAPSFATYSPPSSATPAVPPVGRISLGGPPLCKKCGKPATYVPTYGRYYCFADATYVDS